MMIKRFKRIFSSFIATAMLLTNVPTTFVFAESGKAETILKEYSKGEYNSNEAVEFRKELVEEHNLEAHVDSDYFFKDEYIKDLEEKYLGDLLTLIKMSPNASNLEVSVMTARQSNVVTRPNHDNISAPENSVSYYENGYFMGRTGVYYVNGGVAFCADHNKTDPKSGTVLNNIHEEQNSTIRKILYYGYGGPAQLTGWDANGLRLATAMAISNVRNGDGKTMGNRLINAVAGLSDAPTSFKAYIGDTSKGYQSIAYWEYSPKGQLQIEKSSANPEITNNNNCYSLAGAVYGIYRNSDATNQVATLTTGADGKSQIIELDEGQYYSKEITPPKGFALDNTIYPITVNSGNLAVGKYSDKPQFDPVTILLRKVDNDTNLNDPQGSGSLADAQFTIKFYEGNYSDGVNPADLGVSPTRTWVMKTDEDGFTLLDDSYKVSGDELYIINGVPTLPLGTMTIQETKAPKGYKINPEIFVRKITSDGTAESVNTYNEPIVKEEVIKGRIKVTKVDEETGEKLQGAEFELVNKATEEVVETLITGEDGTATSGLHPFDEYILREIKAPDKYTLNGQEHFITISEDLVTIEVTHQNRIIKGRIEINKEDSEIAGLKLAGVKFGIFDENNSLVEELITDENGYAISGWLNYGDYIAKELETKDGYVLNNQEWKVEIRADQKTYTYNITNDVVKGQIQIVKIDSQNAEKPVEGATFNIVAEDVFGIEAGTVVDTVTTDENGFAFTKELRYGEYYAIETSVGNDYWLNDKKYPITISKNEKIEVVHIKNEPVQMKLRVLKYDVDSETKEAIKGTKFKVVNRETGEDVEFTEFFGIIPYKKTVFTTNKNGEIVFPQILEAGIYSLVETEPAEGYNAIEPIDFVINRDTNYEEIELLGKVTTIEVENTRIKGDLKIVKIDEETQEPLQGVKFKVTCTDGFMKGQEWTEVTDVNGEINLTSLEYGKYEAVEVEGLWNYVENKEPIKFEITENGKTIELTVTNKKIRGSVELLKVDEDTNRPLEGAEFELWNGEKLVDIYVTDKDGKIVVEDLEAGNYYWKEVVAPNNYNVNDEAELYFSILEDKEVIKLEVSNKVKEGEVDFSKTDVSTGELIEGATINIKGVDEQNSHIDFEFVSTKEETRFKLPVGKYEFSETVAPDGYVLSTEVGYFEILENEVIKAELKNKRIEGTLEFEKTDVSTGEVIEGAHIKIECIEGFNKGQVIEFVSSKDGNKFKLEYGKYKFYETLPPEGYELTTEVGEFEITEDGQIVKAQLKNKRIPVPVLPQTGDEATIFIFGFGAIISLAGIIMLRKKKAN
ncbi:MAG: SpaA isopeptide-forming pilin-related protein [uncultured Clostridium sp.]